MEFVANGQRVQRSTKIRIDEPKALKKAKEVERQAKEAIIQEQREKETKKSQIERIRLSEAIERTYLEKWSSNKDSETPVQRMNVALELMGDVYLDEITARDISRLQYDLVKKKGLSDSTVNRYIAAFKTVLKLAHRKWEVINKVPYIEIKEELKGRTRFMTYEEEEKLLNYLAGLGEYDLIDLFSVLLDTGMRFSEANNLSYKDNINLEQEMIYVWINKGGEPKSVPMTCRVKDIILKRRNLGKHPFKLNYYHAYYIFNKFKEYAGLEDDDLVIHSLRHTTASRLVQEDVPLKIVKDILGHSTMQMTERYAHLIPSRLKSAITVLERKNPSIGEQKAI